MCDLNRIGWLIVGACGGVLAAIVFCVIAAFAAGSFLGALGNGALMIAAAVAVGLALASVTIAIVSVGPCAVGACTAPADALRNALSAAAIGLTVLLASFFLAVVGTSIPWAGVAVAIGLGVGAATLAFALAAIGSDLAALARCRLPLPPAGVTVAIGITAGTVFLLVLILAAATGFFFLGG